MTVASQPISYDFSSVEAKWQEAWRDSGQFETPDDTGRPAAYVFVSLPFTSGQIHVGHVRSYAIADADARFRRSRGEAVLFAIGFDAFGLPAEISAIERGMDPTEWVEKCQADMRGQLEALGFSFDWSRCFSTADPDIYKWTQHLFVLLYEAGLIYRREGFAIWCDSCQTILAAAQAEDGRCWRCVRRIELVRLPQWYLRLSAYNEENDRRIAELSGWNSLAKAAQRSVLDRTDGVEFETYSTSGSTLTVFTPHVDAVSGAAFVAMSPLHEDLADWVIDDDVDRRLRKLLADRVVEAGRPDGPPAFVETGSFVHLPGSATPLPVLIVPEVESRYGSTAILGVPEIEPWHKGIAAALPSNPVVAWKVKKPLLKQPSARYRASDFSLSRQRAWGTPVPLVHCDACGAAPAPLEELPVLLPSGLREQGGSGSLEDHDAFLSCKCPRCGNAGRRDTETLDCHMDVSWIYMAAAVPPTERAENMLGHPDLDRWLPASRIINGSDNGSFVLDERTVAKALRDLGVLGSLPSGEPFLGATMHEMVRMDGRKMSKHLGNVVDPRQLAEEHGADALRFAVLYAASPEKGVNWDPSVIQQARAFLLRLWGFAISRIDATSPEEIDTTSHMRRRLKAWCDTATERITENLVALDTHRATRNVMTLLERIMDFERRLLASESELNAQDRQAISTSLLLLTRLLAPLAPHLAEELWERSGADHSVADAGWPAL